MSVEAAKKALAERGPRPVNVNVIIVATVTPDMFFPSTACFVQRKLGATGVWGFDLSAACSPYLCRADRNAVDCFRRPKTCAP